MGGHRALLEKINSFTRRGRNVFVDGNRLAEGLFGSHLAVNLFMVGIAYQGGLIPLSLQAIEQAIRLNEVDVETQPADLRMGPQVLSRREIGGRIPRTQGRRPNRSRSIASRS